jgi:very-short-patch-repair endonuclease
VVLLLVAGTAMGENDNKTAGETTPAAQLSAEFLGGGTAAGLEKLRARLLDLTNRNRLLNFRHSNASSLRIVDANLNAVFARLMDGEEIPFRHVPEPVPPEEPEIDEVDENTPLSKPLAADYAESLGWQTSYDLTKPSPRNAASQCLPVLLYVEDLETRTRKIGSAAKTAIEESGTNMLYLTLGFLEWYESDDSRQPHLAPLVTVPVALNRQAVKGKPFEASLEYSGDDFETNLSLVEKMRLDFGIEIPTVEDEDTPETYFLRFEPILNQKKRWKIRRHISLSLLSFGKLLMYRDLDRKVWPGIGKHPLVTELFEGRKHDTIVHAEEHLIDAPEIKHELPSLVVDADSSQHSALIDALRGQNLVIEGPPGTGKSQTITNLIAAALTAGKTVLFVSDKLAALEVVRRRLDDCGLGIFCLELHSHKTRKDALLNDLATRLKAQGSFRDPQELDQHLSIAEEKKRLLTRYVTLINTTLQPFNATLFEVFWARDRAYQELPFDPTIVEKLLLPKVIEFTRTDVTRTEHFLSVYAQHLAGVLRTCSKLDQHAWAWVDGALSFDDQERVCDVLGHFILSAREASTIRRALANAAGISLNDGLDGLASAGDILAALPDAGEPLPAHMLEPCRDVRVRTAVLEFIEAVEQACRTRQTLAGATSSKNATPLLRKDIEDLLSHTATSLATRGFESCDSTQLRQRLEQGRTAERILSTAEDCFVALASLLGVQIAFDTRSVDLLLKCLGAIEKAPLDVLHLRTSKLESEGADRILETCAVKSRQLQEQHRKLDDAFNLAMVRDSEDANRLRSHATAVESAGIWQRCFGREYRLARRTHRTLARTKTKASRQQAAHDLRSVADHLQALIQFDADAECVELLGAQFRGVETRWNEIQRLAEWNQEVFNVLPETDPVSEGLRDVLLKSRTERLKAIIATLPSHQKHRTAVEELGGAIPTIVDILGSSAAHARPIGQLRDQLKETNSFLEEAIAAILMADLRPDVPISSIGELTKSADRHRRSMAYIESQNRVRQLLGSCYEGVDSDLRSVKAAVRFAASVADSTIPRTASEWLLCEAYFSRLSQLRQWLNQAMTLGHDLQQARKDIRALASSSVWHAAETESLEDVCRKAEHALSSREELAQWLHFVRSRFEGEQAGLTKLIALAEDRRIEPAHLLPAFHFAVFNTLARYALTNHPDLFSFSGSTQDQIREQFAEADKQAIQLYRERAAAIIDRRREIPYGHQSGPVKTWSELALITHEISKQKRHIPIRQLVRRSATALQAMKPCFMMGPLSVAQYLVPERLRFDLVVMDEASQLKPEDAIGSIARGGQMVIVGDPKQLPPTSFFQRVASDDDSLDDDDRTAIEEGESILDVASTLYQPVRRLRWHYRSRHHSLIAFSNREFYEGDLVIFPSAYHESPSLGVKYHPVRGGVFNERRNIPEAEAVVDAVLDHVQNRPNESLGIVALNYEQRELIEELLDRRLQTEPFAIAYQERMNSGSEPLFIKNLENVQGDERDVIFISATYGPDAQGNQYQRFGPINGPNGHRRLNVLFTRSKKRTEVFSSLDPDKIQVSSSSAWGLRALKQYLTFARTGVLEAPDDGGPQPTNDFERSVGAVLRDKGFEVIPQVGVAGFFVDLGVRHPTKPGAYLLGIECDGASYHSGRSARDRDRLRQEILENQAWKIHRVWSTDWFKSRNLEINRLLKRIEDLLNSDPDYRLEMERAQRVASVRQQLINLSEEVKIAFPDSPAASGLLRQALLDEFVRRRPRTRNEWFQISYDLRSQTDSKQVGQYLDRVLSIISSSCD